MKVSSVADGRRRTVGTNGRGRKECPRVGQSLTKTTKQRKTEADKGMRKESNTCKLRREKTVSNDFPTEEVALLYLYRRITGTFDVMAA